MRKTAVRILKGSEVKLEGQFVLDIMQPVSDPSKQSATAVVEPQVRIIETKPDFSVIEITCSCGTLLHLKCEYAGDKTPPAKPPSSNTKAPNKEK